MNTTISTEDSDDWTPKNITGMVNVVLTFICLLVNLHQSYNHKHYKSSCCGDTCFDVIVDTSLSEAKESPPGNLLRIPLQKGKSQKNKIYLVTQKHTNNMSRLEL
jgi:hypothetical protein